MAVVYILLALALAFAIAAVVVGREARRLDAEPPRAVFDPDEAVEWVANHLPYEVSAVLTHDDVRRILDWNLTFLRNKGISGNGSPVPADTPVVVRRGEAVDWACAGQASSGSNTTGTTSPPFSTLN